MSSSGSAMLTNSEKWDPTEPPMFYNNGDYSSWKVRFKEFIQYTDSDLWSFIIKPYIQPRYEGYFRDGAPVKSIKQMTDEERKKRGIGTLPASLWEAIQLTEESKLVRKALGDHVFNAFIKNKKIEWDQYRIQVTEYELKRYLPIL